MTILALLAAVQAAVTPAPAAPTTADGWAAAARTDIEAGYAEMWANHPGAVLSSDPGFKARLDAARAAGLAAVPAVHDRASYAAALERFSYELADGHALLIATGDAPASTPPRWPGFLAAWRGNAMYVVDGEAAPGLGKGARVISCDGTPIAELLYRRLEGGRIRLHDQGEWWAYGTTVLLDDASRLRGPAPKSCEIVPAEGGAAQTITLDYQPQPKDMMARYWAAANGANSDIALTEPRPGMFLIGMPTFDNNPTAAKMYAELNAAIDQRHGELARARAVVLDLRYNQGGSSAFPRDIARHLWGEKAIDTRREAKNRAVEIWWRNTPGNVAHVRMFVDLFAKRGNEAAAKEYGALADRMAAGLAAGENFTNEEPADLTKPVPAPAVASLQIPVYVMVPGQCASACLDALDYFTLMPGVTLIGAPTASDSDYMEIREKLLPSGQGEAIIPNKVWMHRPRGDGEIYRPHIELRQADWSTKAFLDAIDADLSKSAPTR